ncbi:stretch-activated Ca2+-permeable channel component-domain-containing protein [Biscogniauxia mediterranea]|nr:stretch-activated Ca2+-permeable channel component-domain-containing protein [Biscogniauxia mediterranea]
MQLSPLQSRLAASVIASCLLFIIYLLLFSPQFALAAELDYTPSDHGSEPWSYTIPQDDEAIVPRELRSPAYEPDFALFDRSIIGRASGAVKLNSDEPVRSNILPGNTLTYVFEQASVSGRSTEDPSRSLELRMLLNESEDDEPVADGETVRRAASTSTLYISANTCDQPGRISPDQTTMDPPQLTLYVSTTSDNTAPGPGQSDDAQETLVFNEGAVMFNTSLDRDVYLSISAPEVSSKYFSSGSQYNFQVAVSTDEYYHAYDQVADSNLIWVDSDASSTLLRTQNLTSTPDEVLETAPYVMFAQDRNSVALNGIRNSYCGLSSWAQIRLLEDGSGPISIGMKKSSNDNLTRQEFYVSGLNASSQYSGILALAPSNSTSTSTSTRKRALSSTAGKAVVFKATPFDTKPNGACTFIFNLTLCDETQYAVPGNPALFPNGTALAAFYENYTLTMYSNFEKSLDQVPCQAPPTQQYSLVKNCDDCKVAYKNWLCSVAIPRCEDFSSPDRDFLQMRNINAPFPNGSFVSQEIRDLYGNRTAYAKSRNSMIDTEVQPGPYKELLPCDDVCYEIVRSCPASLGFSCPLPDSEFGFNTSYGLRKNDGTLSCNYPGSAHFQSGAGVISACSVMIGIISTFLAFIL